jgi:tungstate transport system permease protein
MALPPVVVGLFLYLLLSWQGVLSSYEILYTPTAMIIAQTIIIIPIVAALSKESIDIFFNKYRDYLISLKISNFKIMKTLLWESRYALIVNGLAGLGRGFAEVGAVIIVGGNIAELTRVMTTAIVLETSRGNFVLAMSLGLTLIFISLILNFFVYFIKKTDELD